MTQQGEQVVAAPNREEESSVCFASSPEQEDNRLNSGHGNEIFNA